MSDDIETDHDQEPAPEMGQIDERDTPEAERERAAWTRDIARMLRGQTAVAPELRPGFLAAAEWLDPSFEAPEGPGAVEWLAQQFHEAYERLAPGYSYQTREASAKPWAEVPDNNRQLMMATVSDLLRTGRLRMGSKFRPKYPDRNDHYVPPRLDVARDSGHRVEVSAPSGWITPEWLRDSLATVVDLIRPLWELAVAAEGAPVEVDLEPLFRWLKLYQDYAERDRPPRMARLELAGADELSGSNDSWWWVDTSEHGDGTHWSRFEGHHVQVDVELSTENEREVNDWKGRDEIRPGGKWLLKLNRQPVAGGYVSADPLRTLDEIKRLVPELMNHAALHHSDPRPYAEQLMYRRVYYDRTPAVVVGTVLDQGCVILRPVGVEAFPVSLYDYDRPDESTDDPYERREAKVELWYAPVHWWRDRLVEGEPAGPQEWAALIERERADEEAKYAAARAEKRARHQAEQDATDHLLSDPVNAERLAVPIDVEDDEDPEGTPAESEHQVTEREADHEVWERQTGPLRGSLDV